MRQIFKAADESDSKHGEQNKDYASGDSVKPLFLVDQDVFGSTKPDRTHWLRKEGYF
jgi:hypothetical protein